MDKDFLPYRTNILIKPAKKDIVLSDRADAPKYWLYGTVLAVGSEVKDIGVGDTVAYDKFGIKDVDKEGQKYFFIADDPNFVLGVIKAPCLHENVMRSTAANASPFGYCMKCNKDLEAPDLGDMVNDNLNER